MGDTANEQPTRCLEENTLDALGRGQLSAAEREAAVHHLDACEDCRHLVAALGHAASWPAAPADTTDEAPPAPEAAGTEIAPPRLPPGSRIGRYTVLHTVGAGGMGVVYAAYDPELDRRVALKLVHHERLADRAREEAASRLLREAQALARLSHPHVITVFDAGRFDGQVFLTMEFVEGGTLRQWARAARAERRSPGAVLEMFLQAGRGLAAAHAAGLVHRDFKPDNVLIGKDGRARVTDFGLVRVAPAGPAAPARPEHGAERPARPLPASAGTQTEAGALLGTPAYMAPELLRGAPADARSDQFAYCVALYEALQGERPFTVTDLGPGQHGARTPEDREPPRGSSIPSFLQGPLARGLSLAPEHRYPSMSALLADLERRSTSPRRRRLTVGALGVAAVLAAGAGALWWRDRGDGVCAHAEERLAGAWDDALKGKLRAAFLATGAPFAQAAWSGTEALVDRYAKRWVQMHTDACEATHVRGEQSGELLDLRMACLAQRREGLRALTAVLASAERDVVERAARAADQLPPLEECASVEALTAPLRPPRDPAARARIEAARGELAEAAAQRAAGRYAQSRALAQKVADEATPLSYRPLEAEAWMAVALADIQLEDGARAEASIYRALAAAQASGHLTVAARAELSLAHVHGVMLRRHPQGHVWADLAAATLERVGDAPLVSADRLLVLGKLLLDEGRANEALPHLQQALALQERALGPDDLTVATTLGRLARALSNVERYPEALALAQRSLAVQERLLGPDHPDLAASLNAIAFILYMSQRSAEGIPLASRALAIQERAFGPDHPALVKTIIGLSNLHSGPRDALALLQRARDIQERSVGAEHPDMVYILKNMAISHGLLRETDEQLACAERALAIEEKLLGPDHPDLANTLVVLGQAHDRLGHPERGLPFLERALAITEARPLTDSYAIGRSARVNIRGQMADTLWAIGRDRGRARALVTGALEVARGGGSEMERDVAALEAWLSAHPLPP
ncbi:protein kinase domain-containing protein [Sorangium sp. So ce1389]|uniref:serine/threonine-protein kinase n=1 Tax=Sorangium sp. So ce1389 TaxID=3133336 RepID=UPI003F6001FE